MTGEWPKGEIDHDDRNPLNDRWVNLKDSTSLQNQANRGASITNLLGVKGIYERDGKYVARHTHNYNTTHLGTFDTIEEAIKAYEEACRD